MICNIYILNYGIFLSVINKFSSRLGILEDMQGLENMQGLEGLEDIVQKIDPIISALTGLF